jgi:hypothetical protein
LSRKAGISEGLVSTLAVYVEQNELAKDGDRRAARKQLSWLQTRLGAGVIKAEVEALVGESDVAFERMAEVLLATTGLLRMVLLEIDTTMLLEVAAPEIIAEVETRAEAEALAETETSAELGAATDAEMLSGVVADSLLAVEVRGIEIATKVLDGSTSDWATGTLDWEVSFWIQGDQNKSERNFAGGDR